MAVLISLAVQRLRGQDFELRRLHALPHRLLPVGVAGEVAGGEREEARNGWGSVISTNKHV